MTAASPPFRIARRLSQVQPSATLALAQRAREMQAQGLDVVSLTAGEPDMNPASHVLSAAKDALDRGQTRYTAVAGLPELRDAVRRRIREEDGVDYGREQVLVTSGAKQAIYNAMESLIEPGDEVVVIGPYWLSYRDMVHLSGGTPRFVSTDESTGFLVSPGALSEAIGPRTRMVILNSPSNPAGATYSREALEALAGVLEKHPQVTVLSDDIYRRIFYSGPSAPSLLQVAPALADRTLVVNGCSKQYAMTGFRIGWAAGPKELISAMTKIQGQSTSNAATPSQYAALAALEGDQSWVDEMVKVFDRRRRIVIELLRAIPGVECFDPRGAFYVFPSLASFLGKNLPDGTRVESTSDLCTYLLDQHHLVGVPGAPFGSPRHLRFSFATDIDTLKKGLDRLAIALRAIG